MAEAWELILHHTYAGTPGVIFDHSPTHRSHGQPVNLADADRRFGTCGSGGDGSRRGPADRSPAHLSLVPRSMVGSRLG